MDYEDFKVLHHKTKEHWEDQENKNKKDLEEIVDSNSSEILVHEHTIMRNYSKPPPSVYKERTIEACVITDPYLYQYIQDIFGLKEEKEVNLKIFQVVHKTLVMAEPYLRHKSISKVPGGFRLRLNGIRVLKDWGFLKKMDDRDNLQNVMFDLGDFMQV